jgi:amino acid adenylation domain-containing protein
MMSVGDIEDIYELSPLQQGLLYDSLYDDSAEVHLNQRSYIIEGPLDTELLLHAWQQTVAVHTSLRTSFHWEGLDKPLQVVHRDVPVIINRHDWSAAGDEHLERFNQLLAEDLANGFDPAVPPLQRLHLIQMGDRRHGIIWTHHLLIMDGWSAPIFVNQVMQRYLSLTAGRPAPPPAPPYRDYIAWLQRQDLNAARDFWVSSLPGRADATPLAPMLPADPQRTAGPLGERVVNLPGDVEAGLRAVAASHRVTLNTMLHAAWALVLQRYTGEAEVTFGCTSSARPPELPDVDQMVGLFTNTLPFRIRVPDDGDLGAWLRDIQARYTEVRRYEYSPLAEIKRWIGASGPQPLFHSLVIFDNYPLSIEVGDLARRLSMQPVNAVEKTSVPLLLIATPEPRFTLRVRFHSNRFTTGSAEEILECFQATLAALAKAERIAPVAAALRPRTGGQGDIVRYRDADRTLPELIERQSQATPDAPAVLADDGTLSYRELLGRARRAAAALSAAGAGPGHVVGVCAERSPDMVTGLLGAMLAGAAYLPLDPSVPAARLAVMVSDAGAGIVLAQRATAGIAHEAGARHVLTLDDLPAVPGGYARPAVSGGHAAYVMFTSGSTGRPKGVVITHQAIMNRLLWMQETFPLTPEDRVMQKTPFGFDVSLWEFFWPLTTGAAMALARPGGHQDAEYLAQTIMRRAVTTAHFVPSMLQLFLDEPAAASLPALRRVVCSGEQLPYPLVERFQALLPQAGLHNLYGPTEAAVDVTWWDCSRPGPPGVIPIGHPIANTQAYVLDRRLMEAPCNVPGELYLGGVQLARGYINRPGLTAATFVAHPLAGPGAGSRLYRTGDKVRRLPDGSLEFLGRLDHQVKVNGYRIELSEIEQVLVRHPSVREAIVVVRERAGSRQLAAYVTGAGNEEPDPQALRAYLQVHLPRYMVPATFMILSAMPLTHNGKLDRAALPDPLTSRAGNPRAVPGTPLEELIATVYCEVLGLTEVDVIASFFELGGNSFDAVRAVRRVEGATVGLLAAHPSVRELAAVLDQSEGAERRVLWLTEPGPAAHTLVCVPFGGGSAITYQQMARALSSDLALLAVSLPGHELGGETELRPLDEVAQECAASVIKLTDGPISVYGHCAGVAMAVELVRRLEAANRPVERLFLAAAYPFYEPGPVSRTFQRVLAALVKLEILDVSAISVGTTRNDRPRADQAEMRYLRSIGGFDARLDDKELAFVMRAFRHDVKTGSRYFSERWSRDGGTAPLAAPITFIAGTEDPLTPRYPRRYRAWERFGAGVELLTVPGGHYFHQQLPKTVTEILESRCAGPSAGACPPFM